MEKTSLFVSLLCRSVAVPAGKAAIELLGGDFMVEVPLCSLRYRQKSAGAPSPLHGSPGQVPSGTAWSIPAAGSARSAFPRWPHVPHISLLGRNVLGSCLWRGLCLGQASPHAVQWGLGLPLGLRAAQPAAMPPRPGNAGSGSGRLLMWSINRGGDRVGQRREAGPVKHCGQ